MKRVMKRLVIGLVVVCAAMVGRTAAPEMPVIRYASGAPFADGKRVEPVWKAADVLSRFSVVRTFALAVDRSEAQLLFDERNLYVSMRGFFDPKELNEPAGATIGNRNNFEFFIQMDTSVHRYLHVTGDDFGRTRVDITKAALPCKEVLCSVERHPDNWVCNLTIPFSFLGVKAPTDDLVVKCGIMRQNLSVSERLRLFERRRIECSSFTPNNYNYGIPEDWSDMRFTRTPGAARTVVAPDMGLRVNLMANGDCDVPNRVWRPRPDTDLVETQALSGEWIYRTHGKGYIFLQADVEPLEPNTDYTLIIKARKFGGEGIGLNSLMLERVSGKGVREACGTSPKTALGDDFHEYYHFFNTGNHRPSILCFYKFGIENDGAGLDISAVRLYKGKVSSLELRKLGRVDRRKVVPGTAPKLRENPYGRVDRPFRALVLTTSDRTYALPDAQSVFRGLGCTVDYLMETGKEQDTYVTDDDPSTIETRIRKGEYDVYLVPANGAEKIGPELVKLIEGNVRKGAGLYVEKSRAYGGLAKLMSAAALKPLAADDSLRKFLPSSFVRYKVGAKDPSVGYRQGILGNGRVISAEVAGSPLGYRVRMENADYGPAGFPIARFSDPWMVRAIRRVAGAESGVFSEVTVADDRLRAVGSGLADGTKVVGTVFDRYGNALSAVTGLLKGGVAEICLPEIANGRLVAEVKALTSDGATVDWASATLERDGARFGTLACDKEGYVSAESVGFRVGVLESAPGLTVAWTMEDFAGRVLECGETAATAEVSVSVPLGRLYTNIGIVRFALMRNGKVLDRLVKDVYARDLDIVRTDGDFTASQWPQGSSYPYEDFAVIDRQLERIGFRAAVMSVDGARAVTPADGLACAGGVGVGDSFFYQVPHKTHVRERQVNTAVARAGLDRQARRAAQDTYRYGITQTALCDEPMLARPGTTDELDEHPENLAVYRERMEWKYGTIAVYNRRHGTTYAAFADLKPGRLAEARAEGKYAEFIEWRNFNVDRWCEAIKVVADAGAAVDPNARLSLFNSFGQSAFSGNDYWKLLTKSGLGFSNEYTAMVRFGREPVYNFDEFYRSFRPDMRVWGYTGYFMTAEQVRFMPWWFAAHRYGGFTWFAALCWDFSVLDSPTYAINKDGWELKESLERSRMLDGVGKLTIDYPWAKRDVAIWYSHESMLLATALGKETQCNEIAESGPLHDYMYSRQGAQYAIEDLLYQHDFVAGEQVVGPSSVLSSYRILFMPRILTMSDAEVAAVKAFVKSGGAVVADVLPGDYDELGVKRAKNPFSGLKGVTVLGKNFGDQDESCRTFVLRALSDAGATPTLRSPDIVKRLGREAMRFTDGVNDLFVVLRMPGRSVDKETETFVFPKTGHVYDVRTGAYKGRTDRVTAQVPVGDAGLWAVLPEKAPPPVLSVPSRVRRGEVLTLDVSVAAPGRRVFHVEFVPPKGECRFFMKRNLSASDGKAVLRYPVAFNEETGVWKLSVTDVLTGEKARTDVMVF